MWRELMILYSKARREKASRLQLLPYCNYEVQKSDSGKLRVQRKKSMVRDNKAGFKSVWKSILVAV